jgi:plasmid stabilization system protein ParE
MTYSVVTTQRAIREIEEAADWWARNRSKEQAQRWYLGIYGAIGELATSAERCPLATEHEQFSFVVRQRLFGVGRSKTHRIVFTTAKSRVIVLTVRHVGQDVLKPSDLP